MPNIPGTPGYVSPDVFTRVQTIRRSVSIPGGLRIPCIMGLGESVETVVLSAEGSGADGVNPDFAASNAPDGRHFELAKTNLIANRTTILKNSIPLTGIEQTITTQAFDSRYDYRFEPATGRLELQRAHLVDQAGSYYLTSTNNVGTGTISNLSLIDANAPTETWTIRCTSVINDAYGDPISENATFNVVGSVSGTILDAYGAPVVWTSDATVKDNGILRFAITEGATAFDRGDRFTVKVESGVLSVGDTLEARYIATEDLNDPEFFTDANSLFQKHGYPSESNTLSLGASMAFENGAFGVLALQAKPALPRRTSEVLIAADDPLTDGTEGLAPLLNPPSVSSDDVDLFKFTIDGGLPDSDTSINIFVIDATSGDETQIFPNKVSFYNSLITADPYNNFIDNANYTYSYTVVLDGEVEDEGTDGESTSGTYTFQADSASFASGNLDTGEDDTLKYIRILNTDEFGNDVTSVAGTYTISSIGGGVGDSSIVTLGGVATGYTGTLPFTDSITNLRWELVDPADESARILFTKDLNTSGAMGEGDGIRISYIDQDDADFFDNNWADAFEALEPESCQIVVPLPEQNFSAIRQAAKAHVELMSNTTNKKERVLFTGAQVGVTAQALLGNELVAVEDIGVLEGIQGDDAAEVLASNIEDLQNFGIEDNFGTSFRVIYFYPDQIVRVISGTRTNIPGYYIAAAAAGWFASQADVSIPITRKTLTGFSILRSRTYKQQTINSLGGAGVAVLVPVTGGGRVVHGRTTVASGAAEEEEASVVFIRDRVAQVMRDVLSGFIGQPEDATLASAIASKAIGALNGLASQNLIQSYRNVNVSRDSVDPRQWNVIFEIAPTLPVGWIFVDISVGV